MAGAGAARRLRIVGVALSLVVAAPAAAAQSVGLPRADSVFDLPTLVALAEQGDKRAAFLLGTRYASGRGGVRDDSEAVRWFREAAESGLAEAQYNLGVMYARGRGVQADPVEAARWFRRAAEQGLAEAQFNLGTLYGMGQGVERDEGRAAAWLERAAQRGLAEAQYNLGVLYEHGRGVRLDARRALDWYRRAADQGFAPAAERFDALERRLAAGGGATAPATVLPSDAPAASATGAAADPSTPQSPAGAPGHSAMPPGDATPAAAPAPSTGAEAGAARGTGWLAALDRRLEAQGGGGSAAPATLSRDAPAPPGAGASADPSLPPPGAGGSGSASPRRVDATSAAAPTLPAGGDTGSAQGTGWLTALDRQLAGSGEGGVASPTVPEGVPVASISGSPATGVSAASSTPRPDAARPAAPAPSHGGGAQAGGGVAWIAALAPGRYTVQLASFVERSAAERLRSSLPAGTPSAVYASRPAERRRYAVVMGDYPSTREAEAAVAALPQRLRRLQPWIRRVEQIQAVMNGRS
jgi:TPR repeat protein